MNLRANSAKKTAQASDRILYKNLTLSVETFTKSNDFIDVPIVCDDGSVILAHKVTLAFCEIIRLSNLYLCQCLSVLV